MTMLKNAIKSLDEALVLNWEDQGKFPEFAAACIRFVQCHGAAAYTAIKAAEDIEKKGVYSKKNRTTLEGLAKSETW